MPATEAADGTQFRAGAVVNEPVGDGLFWQTALMYHLGPFYGAAVPMEAGDYLGVLFESKDSEPFYYLVMVNDREDELIVVEAFLPTALARETRLSDVLRSIAGGVQ